MVASHLSAAVTAARSADTSSARVHQLGASPETCFWGYFDRDMPTVLEIESGDIVEIEAVTHHSGDAPDLLMDEGVEVLWQGIPQAERGPGAHIMTGPITVADAEPGDTLLVNILDMRPRMPYGSNCAANWGLLYDTFQKERITIYELTGDSSTGFTATAEPRFGFDYVAFELYDKPGTISPVDEGGPPAFLGAGEGAGPTAFRGDGGITRGLGAGQQHTSERVRRQRRQTGDWAPGAAMAYPVFVEGAGLFVGDPHFAQGRRRNLRHGNRGVDKRTDTGFRHQGRARHLPHSR